MNMKLGRVARRKVFLIAVLAGWAAGVSAATVEDMLKSYPVPRGVACVPACGDGAAALELARTTEFLILALDEDAAKVAALKEKAAEAGFLGRNLYVEQGSLEALPFADHYVDLLALPQTAKAGLSAKAQDEIVRVLTPIHGKAFLQDGVIEKPELPGSDWWTHKLHGPNNNAVSQDTAFQFPPILQYRALAMYSSGHGAALSGNGMNFEFNPWTFQSEHNANNAGRLFARNTYNGRILWQSTIPPKMLPNLSLVGLTDREILMAAGERGRIVRLDPRSGAELPPIDIGDENVIIRWLEHDKGVIYLLLGKPADDADKAAFSRWLPLPESQFANQTLFGDVLAAWDMKAGKFLWRHEEPVGIDYRTVALHEGRLFFYSEMHRLACLDAADGTLLWENRDKTWLEKQSREKRQSHVFNARLNSMIVADGIIYLMVQGGKASDASFNAEDGKLIGMPGLMKGFYGPHPQKYMIFNRAILFRDKLFDPATGEQIGEVPSPAGTAWCGRVTYAPGTGALGHSSLGYKSVCAVGAWVAGGVLTYFPGVGDGNPLPGAIAYVSGAATIERAEKQPEHPLVKGPTFDSIGNQKAAIANPGDWVAHRGNAGHSGSSSAAVGRGATIAWKWSPTAPFAYSTLYNNFTSTFDERPTSPLCVGDRVFSAGSDGVVRAHALADGKELWRFYADGPILTSPAWSAGMLFVPGADGWVYALEAASGRLAWKRRLAPLERRILMFDQLVSTWPVLSLVVDGETLFAAAGHNKTDGVKTFALNARTGEVIWSRYSEPAREQFHSVTQPPDRPDQGIGGNMCLVNNRVWAAGYGTAPLCLDKATGKDHLEESKKLLTESRTVLEMSRVFNLYAQEVVRLDDKLVLAGGSDLFENQNIRAKNEITAASFKLYYCNDDGDWQLEPMPRMTMLARFAPACDDELLVWAGGDARWAALGLKVWRVKDFITAADAMQTGPFLVKKGNITRLNAKSLKPFDHSGAAWQKPDLDINDVVLAKDAVVVAHATGREFNRSAYELTEDQARQALIRFAGWRITAFSRDGKETLWEADLPSEPLFNGLAIAADGTVIVALRDGSMVALRD